MTLFEVIFKHGSLIVEGNSAEEILQKTEELRLTCRLPRIYKAIGVEEVEVIKLEDYYKKVMQEDFEQRTTDALKYLASK